MLPVSFSPSALNVNVVAVMSPPRPGISPDHFPETSAASTTETRSIIKQHAWILVLIASPLRPVSDQGPHQYTRFIVKEASVSVPPGFAARASKNSDIRNR